MPTTSTSRSASSSDARAARRALVGAAAAAAALAAARAAPAAAQGAVRGQLALVAGGRGVDAGGAVVYLERQGGGDGGSDGGSDGGGGAPVPDSADIAMRRREFLPHVQLVRAGGRVAFPNDDPFSHNVFSNTTLGAFDLGLYRFRASRAARFARPGVYPIYCNIHHRMVSFVVAVPTGHAARPDADGRFALPDVPAGRWVLHAWHERAGAVTRTLDVPPSGLDDVRVVLDAQRVAPAPHLNKFGLPYVGTRGDRY